MLRHSWRSKCDVPSFPPNKAWGSRGALRRLLTTHRLPVQSLQLHTLSFELRSSLLQLVLALLGTALLLCTPVFFQCNVILSLGLLHSQEALLPGLLAVPFFSFSLLSL